MIYQCFYFTKTAKNAIFGSLLLRSGYNSDKLRFNAWFNDFPYSGTPQDHDQHPADHGLHFEQILGFCPSRRSKSPIGRREDGPVTASRVGVSTRSPQKGGRKPELEAGALFLHHRQQKCRKRSTKCHPRLNRGAGIDIMPRNRYSRSYDHLP